MEDHPFEISVTYQGKKHYARVIPRLDSGILKYRIKYAPVEHLPSIEIEVCPDEDPVGGNDMFWIQREEKDRSLMQNPEFIQLIGVAISSYGVLRSCGIKLAKAIYMRQRLAIYFTVGCGTGFLLMGLIFKNALAIECGLIISLGIPLAYRKQL